MKVRKAVFPAAGLGTRFLPATKVVPKELIPLVDRPAIQYVIEEVVDSGLRQVVLITGKGKSAIEDHFDRAFELESVLEARGKSAELEEIRRIANLVDIAAVRQGEALGLGHAVLTARSAVGHEPFAVLLSDDLVVNEVPCLRQLLDVHATYGGCVVAVERVSKERTQAYGVIDPEPVEGRVFRVKDLVEKPEPSQAPSNLAIIGRYVLVPEVFEELENTPPDVRGEIQLTDGLRSLLKRQPIYALEFEGKRFDTGNKQGFLQATVEFALQRKDLGSQFRAYLASLDLG
jgi:UTP--glucose-1-phosphate uridylyltransferase